jgi:GntR family transcriptional regulator
MIDQRSSTPRWVLVYEVIRTRIERGVYGPGERVPSVRDLADEFGIALNTGQKVMKRLRLDGRVCTVPGMGSYVAA